MKYTARPSGVPVELPRAVLRFPEQPRSAQDGRIHFEHWFGIPQNSRRGTRGAPDSLTELEESPNCLKTAPEASVPTQKTLQSTIQRIRNPDPASFAQGACEGPLGILWHFAGGARCNGIGARMQPVRGTLASLGFRGVLCFPLFLRGVGAFRVPCLFNDRPYLSC